MTRPGLAGPGRTPAALVEATRHEALLSIAFAETPVTILCPSDATRLPAWVLTASPRTHPVLVGPAGGRVVETAVHTRGGGVPGCGMSRWRARWHARPTVFHTCG